MRHTLHKLILGSLALVPAIGSLEGCSKSTCVELRENEISGEGSSAIRSFASEDELSTLLNDLDRRRAEASAGCNNESRSDGTAMGSAAPESASASGASNTNITNNQEAGVDEGGIVKNINDSLVVLRKGRLYAVSVAGSSPTQTDVVDVARHASLNQNVWYDEMLVKGDLIYVIGFRYGVPMADGHSRGATEIDSFRLTAGKLTRLRSLFLESNDYYSSKNYTSRLLDGKLTFYMPHYVGRSSKGTLTYPRVLEADDNGKFTDVGPIFGALDVFRSLSTPYYPSFHTIVKCDLPDTGELKCSGKSVLGNWWRQNYVSGKAVYLWADKHVYRFDFATLQVTAHASAGSPIDQFSFRESSSDLLVAVNKDSKTTLLQLPLANFNDTGAQSVKAHVLADGSMYQNRFVGDVLVAAHYEPNNQTAYRSSLVTFDPTKAIKQSASVDMVQRIEPLGDRRALIATSNGSSGLELRAFSVDMPSAQLGAVKLSGIAQGESRSHGFFYKPSDNGAGTFGYAVVNNPYSGASWGWGDGVSNVAFFDVTGAGALASLGMVSAGKASDTCETSCVDWYGNTRPIFLKDRTFALMGSDLAEVSLRPSVTRLQSVTLQSAPTLTQ